MDIKNILNEADRRANTTAPRSPPPNSPTPPSRTKSPHSHRFLSDPPAPQSPSRLAAMQPHNSTPPQQIVYTGPVYQFQPAVQVRHMGNSIQYRYSPYPYEDPHPVNYTVYQEYSELPPRSHSPTHRQSDSRLHPPHRDDIPRPTSRAPYYRPCSSTSAPTRRYPTFQHAYPPEVPPASYNTAPMPDHRPMPPPKDPFTATDTQKYAVAHHRHQSRMAHRHPESYLSYVSYPTQSPGYGPVDEQYSHNSHPPDFETYKYYSNRESSPPRERLSLEKRPSSKQSRSYSEEQEHVSMEKNGPPSGDDESSGQHHQRDTVDPAPRRVKRRERPTNAHSSTFHRQKEAVVEEIGKDDDVSDVYPQYSKDFLDVSSQHNLPAKSVTSHPPKTSRTKMDSRVRPKAKTAHSVPQNSRERFAEEGPPRKKKRLKSGSDTSDMGEDPPDVGMKISKSPVSIDDGSVRKARGKQDCGRVSAETSSCHDSDVVLVDDDNDSGTVSEREDASSIDDESVRQRERDSERYRRSLIASVADPDEPYPETYQQFSGIPANAVGDMLHLWEFVNAFSGTLRLSSFKLRHLEKAIVHNERSPLLDACITRLMRSILADKELVDELGVSNTVYKAVNSKSRNAITKILEALHHILSFESDEVYDESLLSTVNKLENSSDKWAFYRVIEPAGKLRILRELVDYVVMTDKIRNCISDSMEHAEEEKKKAREENAANRKKLETQIKRLKAELFEFRVKAGLVDPPADSEREKFQANDTKESTASEDNTGDSSKENGLSRKEKLVAAKKEREEEEDRRANERVADGIVARLDKLKANLKMLKNLRLRNRTSACAKEGDLFDSSAPAPSMPFAAPHEDPVRTHPMGTDRKDRRYWFFEGSGRIWIEDTKSGEWSTINTSQGLNKLLCWLSTSRPGEQQLKKRIRQREQQIALEMANEKKSIELGEEEAQESATEATSRGTRAGKRRAERVQKDKTTSRGTGTFLDYRNLVK